VHHRVAPRHVQLLQVLPCRLALLLQRLLMDCRVAAAPLLTPSESAPVEDLFLGVSQLLSSGFWQHASTEVARDGAYQINTNRHEESVQCAPLCVLDSVYSPAMHGL
jgi:hypothetical protein